VKKCKKNFKYRAKIFKQKGKGKRKNGKAYSALEAEQERETQILFVQARFMERHFARDPSRPQPKGLRPQAYEIGRQTRLCRLKSPQTRYKP